MALSSPVSHVSGACPAGFSPISASTYVRAINPGWNLGNTLDAVPTEGSWNNAPVQGATFDDVKSAGFKSVRIPGQFGQAPSFASFSIYQISQADTAK